MRTTPRPLSFLLATWEGGGSIPPVLEVARKLLARGHAVRVMSDACTRQDAEAVGARFVPWTRAPSRTDRTRETELLRDWEPEDPLDGLRQTIDAVWMGPALAYARDVVEELAVRPADLVVTSEMLFGVAVGCEAVRQRHALLAVNLSLPPLPGLPPFGLGLPPARAPSERALYDEMARGNVGLFDHGLAALNAARATLGLRPLAHAFDQLQSAERFLLATSRAFDFEADPLPPHVRYVGPQLAEPEWAQPWRSPWSAHDPRPLVLVGFSTTFQNHGEVLQRVMDAAAELPVRMLVTRGEGIHAHELRPPANAVVAHSAPHDAVMREAAVVVTHGGHGTVCRALVHRRPMLVIPHGRDQNDNAARVAERGAGLRLPPSASSAEIREHLARLLNDPSFRQAAEKLGEQVASEARNSPIVEELEQLAGLRDPADEATLSRMPAA